MKRLFFICAVLLMTMCTAVSCINEIDEPQLPEDTEQPKLDNDSLSYIVRFSSPHGLDIFTTKNKKSRAGIGDFKNVKAIYILTDMISPLNTCYGYLDIISADDGSCYSNVKFNDAFKGKEVILDVLFYDADILKDFPYYTIIENLSESNYHDGLVSLMNGSCLLPTQSNTSVTSAITQSVVCQGYSQKFVLGAGTPINVRINQTDCLVDLTIKYLGRLYLEGIYVVRNRNCLHKFDLNKASFDELGYPILDASCMWPSTDFYSGGKYKIDCNYREGATNVVIPTLHFGIMLNGGEKLCYQKNCIILSGRYYGESSETRYYRIDFKKDNEFFDILPNQRYSITVEKITGYGVTSYDLALRSLESWFEVCYTLGTTDRSLDWCI